jgi:hypothetical protein
MLEAKWLAERKAAHAETDSDEDEDESPVGRSSISKKLDYERIKGVKALLFDIHRVKSGEDLLNVPEFIDFLIELSEMGGDTTFGNAL